MGQLLDTTAAAQKWSSFLGHQALISLAIFCIVFLVLRTILQEVKATKRPLDFPPGPKVIPFIGNVPLFKKPDVAIEEVTKQYGEVCSVMVGKISMVFVSGYQAVKEVLVHQGHAFADRPNNPLIKKVNEGLGIIFAPYGKYWMQHRRFTLSTLRNFGLGKSSIEQTIQTEVGFLIEAFKQKGSAFDPHYNLNSAVGNIICSMVKGKRYEYSDKQFQVFLHLIENNLQLQSGPLGTLCNIFPFLIDFPGPQQRIFKNMAKSKQFIRDIISERHATRDPLKPMCLIDTYLSQLEKEDNPNTSFSEQSLIMLTLDLFTAGAETTSTTLRWGLLYMMMHPEIQAQCHEEIDKIVGSDRLPCMEDRHSLPYLDAVIHEIQRFSNIIPFGVPHATTTDVKLRQYSIPKGTIILVNMKSVLSDENHWKTPYEFSPENFLDEDGKFVKSDAFLPFSAGPRVCLGENLAKMELFLFFASLLQHFEFIWPDLVSPPTLDYILQITKAPKSYKLGLHLRN
ncbi:cytochrome P450 2C31-like [Lethenteron reissneri]|uniref:LOW QUALITY PROTEIN: cytochrome P450 2C31-like n=1 Tax=Lethenteron reissneri TaxID=7753 RepID=UPI002AB764D1|nr:LOW QUALITY PROTEIN: cytochrome P450 2C31-like [Lethenteron reissneri]XP_061433682.1 cytochrome P450 2C31-like [Lethenteron reissneri]XP_061433683.1 cytochrome P450 2C31-like [Lethenteron reissneri]XP_061433684.1 cytochrome P450 2C31-like [Lethenteron reissneri]XP_061433685.1 cytochrome P450 2C31-like [Lethenteron reissneri]